jgi:hypothetical protein
VSLPAVLIRSFDTMLRVSYRQALNVATTFCASQNIPLSVASMAQIAGSQESGAMLDFQTGSMRARFDAGRAAARSKSFWRTPSVRLEPWEQVVDLLRP